MHPTLFPIFVDMRDREVLVVGAGTIARRKIDALLAAGARVRVGAPHLDAALHPLHATGRIRYFAGHFAPYWLDDVWLVIAATDHPAVNHTIAAEAAKRAIWANVVDDAEASSFHVPARVERGALQIAISSGGAAPMLSRWVRERVEAMLDDSLGALCELLRRERARIRAVFPKIMERRRFFDRVLAGSVPRLLRQHQNRAAEQALTNELEQHSAMPASGSVILVGAGPGDPGLLTLKALRALHEADVILHDRLVSDAVLALARRDAERIEVGKQAGQHHTTQEQIHALLLEHATAGRRVVRLKGGDPFVFGRGGEELDSLRAAGVPVEVVPGVTAACAAAAGLQIPLTHRDTARSLHFVTGHGSDGRVPAHDWRALAASGGTIAAYMASKTLRQFALSLIEAGLAASTPAVAVENASRPNEVHLHATLATLADRLDAHDPDGPTMVLIGSVVALSRVLQPPTRIAA